MRDGKSIITMDGPPARSIGEDVGGLLSYGILMGMILFLLIM